MSFDQPAGHGEDLMPIGEVVERLRSELPDITHSKLRFLEREGLLVTHRSQGGHRLFSPTDLERIRQIGRWQAQGLPLSEIRERMARLDTLPSEVALSATFLDHALAGDLDSARQMILAADDVGLPLAQMLGNVLQPALIDTGRRWASGELLVAQEKEVSELVRELIAALTVRHAPPDPAGPEVVAACVQGERHEIGLRMICSLLRVQGYPVHFLGADVAAPFLGEAVRLRRPALILLSVNSPGNLAEVAAAIEHLQAIHAPEPVPPIVVGGRATLGQSETISAWGAIMISHQALDLAVSALTAVLGAAASGDERSIPVRSEP